MAANYYYSKSKGRHLVARFTPVVKGDITHRPGRRRYTYENMRIMRSNANEFCKQGCVNIRGEEIGPTLLETNSYGERIYGICLYPTETSCQVKPPIKSLFGHKREESPTYS